ncbi:hypothetical protein ACW7G2_01990 [Luteimonas sp. A277]
MTEEQKQHLVSFGSAIIDARMRELAAVEVRDYDTADLWAFACYSMADEAFRVAQS